MCINDPRIRLSLITALCAVAMTCAAASGGAAAEPPCDRLRSAIAFAREFMSPMKACVSSVGTRSPEAREVLDYAIRYRREDVVLGLIGLGVRYDYPKMISLVALYELPNALSVLLDERAANHASFADLRDDWTYDPLVQTAISGAYMSARVLLERGFDPDTNFPLLHALKGSRTDVAHLLIDYGASVGSLPAPMAGSLLGAVAEYGDPSFMQFLLAQGISADSYDQDGFHVLLYTPHHADPMKGRGNWQFLVSQGADPQKAICQIPKSEHDNVRKVAPGWFVAEFNRLVPNC